MSARPITPVILSGGSGVRLWPLSRLGRPKQLIALAGEASLLQQTANRVADPDTFAAPIVVAADGDAASVQMQLAGGTSPPRLFILEPKPHGTAAAIAAAAAASEADDLLLVLPSDHAIADEEGFLAAIELGRPAAKAGQLVCFGAQPERPETGYGYIRAGDEIHEGVFRAAAFREKPDRAGAEAMLAEGGWLWNAGIFLFKAGAFLGELARTAPKIAEASGKSVEDAQIDGETLRLAGEPFEGVTPLPVDRAVMERSDKVAVVPVSIGWSDLGSWEAVHALGPQDGDCNVMAGDVVAPGSRGCLIRSDGPTVVALGLEDIVVIATERAVLVVPRGETQRIQEALDALESRKRKD